MNTTYIFFDAKRISILLCMFALMFMLHACGENQPSEDIKSEITTIEITFETMTELETTTAPPPAWPFAPIPDKEPPGQSHEPLRQNEMVIERASVNDIVKRFGAYEGYSTSRQGTGDDSIIELRYTNLTVMISYRYMQLSFSDEDWNTWYFGDYEVQLTQADKAVEGRVSRLFWTDPDVDLPVPRGLKIGDSEEKVLRSYLDLRAKYKDADSDNPWRARIIYSVADSTEQPAIDFNSSGYYRVYMDESPPVPCDYSIHYNCNDMGWMLEGTVYYIKNSKIVAIGQHCAEGD